MRGLSLKYSAFGAILPVLIATLQGEPAQADVRSAQVGAPSSGSVATLPVNFKSPVVTLTGGGDDEDSVIVKKDQTAAEEKKKERDFNAPIASRDKRSFFPNNSASTIFKEKVRINEKPGLEYFNARYLDSEEEAATELPAEQAKPEEKKNTQPATRDEIQKAYGNPTEDDKILALEHAPDSFKGMMAALQIQDEELAWEYAQRYARRVREMKTRSIKTVGLIGRAMESEGMLPPNSWANAPEFQEQQNLVDQEVKSSGLEDETARIAGLDPKTRAFLKKAQDAEELGAKAQGQAQPAGQAPAMSEQAERAQVRQSVTGKVPVDPKGEVLVYFFFRPYDRASLEQVPDIEALYRSLATQPGVTFLGMTFDAMTPPEIENFRKSTNATFPVKNGHRLVTEFGIKQVPTVGLISPNTGKAVFEEHKRSFVYFDELVNIMRGK